MEREGFRSDRAVRLMRLNDQAWRFCRVVIDAEPHLGVMGFAAAVDFLSAAAHMDRYEAEIECRRYAVKRGQAMSYLVGRRELEHLAARCSASRPASLREFHDDLPGWGAAPPAVIARGMDPAPAPPAAALRP